MKTVVEILVCVVIVAIEIAVIVAILAPHVLVRALRSLLPRRRLRGSAGAH
jgi:predicted lysophospholipase L1 biosynthesis ABC-type transport system permease subunit